jgi:hypothetical protein
VAADPNMVRVEAGGGGEAREQTQSVRLDLGSGDYIHGFFRH